MARHRGTRGGRDRRLDEQAARYAESAPAVAQATADLDRTRDARTALDDAVEQARGHRDEALVVARCEYNPTPDCPETRITGDPGVGPETQTANELLAGAQLELDNALAARDRRAPELDSEIADGEQALSQARETARSTPRPCRCGRRVRCSKRSRRSRSRSGAPTG